MEIQNQIWDCAKNIDIPVSEEEWRDFPSTKRGKVILLAVQCAISVITSLITMWLFLG